MNVFVAKTLMSSLLECHEALKRVEEAAKKIESKEDYTEFMKKVLSVAGELEDGPMLHLVQEHPELNPFPEWKKRER